MPRFVICLGALFALILSLGVSVQTTRAAELAMVEGDGCPWCDAFDREIAPILARTRFTWVLAVDSAMTSSPAISWLE